MVGARGRGRVRHRLTGLPLVPSELSFPLMHSPLPPPYSISRASETASLDEINLEEKELFQSGKKLVGGVGELVFVWVCVSCRSPPL